MQTSYSCACRNLPFLCFCAALCHSPCLGSVLEHLHGDVCVRAYVRCSMVMHFLDLKYLFLAFPGQRVVLNFLIEIFRLALLLQNLVN